MNFNMKIFAQQLEFMFAKFVQHVGQPLHLLLHADIAILLV
jgi:hypothetical protein